MNAVMRPIAELREQATEILIREMGIVDAVRFLSHFRAGSGDYTKERWLNKLTLAQISSEIKSKRKKTRRTNR